MPDNHLARELEVAANGVLDACLEEYASLPSIVRHAVDDWKQASEAFAQGQRARVPSDRPTDIEPAPAMRPDPLERTRWEGNAPGTTVPSFEEPEPSGRSASPDGDLPGNFEVLAAHIQPDNREFTVRVYQCDFHDKRVENETLARTFPTEAKARQFYGQTQNVWNMRVRAKEAPGYDVVLGVQDVRKHAKKKSYREWEHSLCKGGAT